MMDRIITIDLLRHGEPLGGRRYRGQTDDPLSDRGWQQMWQAVDPPAGWQRIVSSPLLRCAAFGEALGARLSVPVQLEPRFMEIAFGTWEGRLPAEICAEDALRLFRFRRDPVAEAPPGAEPLAQFHARCVAAWQELLGQADCEHLLIVAHAGVIRMLLCEVLGLAPSQAYRLDVGNAGLSRVRMEQHGGDWLPVLQFHNRLPPENG